ncbi:MAG: ribulose-phosphate 3-epimerase [Pelolinea sp.]|nr:ribulose-phosphate 3-epimerase [Pelolinea sp.]
MEPIVSASILNCDFGNLESELKKAERAGVDWFHMDIIDGHFAPNLSFGPGIVSLCDEISDLPLDTHLMISNPDDFIEAFANAGSDFISVHIEGNPNIHRTLQFINSMGKRAGIVVNPGTPVETVYDVLHMVSHVLVMTVNPGFGGQKFIPETLIKIEKLSAEIKDRGLDVKIEVDGGINRETAKKTVNSGANILVAGTYIFSNKIGIKEAVRSLKGL